MQWVCESKVCLPGHLAAVTSNMLSLVKFCTLFPAMAPLSHILRIYFLKCFSVKLSIISGCQQIFIFSGHFLSFENSQKLQRAKVNKMGGPFCNGFLSQELTNSKCIIFLIPKSFFKNLQYFFPPNSYSIMLSDAHLIFVLSEQKFELCPQLHLFFLF